MGKSEGFAKEFAFLKLWSLYGYIAFDRRDNHKNYGIFVQTKQAVEIPLLGLELRFYRLRCITLQAIAVVADKQEKILLDPIKCFFLDYFGRICYKLVLEYFCW